VEARDRPLTDETFVRANIAVQPGDAADPRRISRGVNALLATERFSAVDSELRPVAGRPDTFDLVFLVQPRPRLDQPVRVVGANGAGEKKVREWLDLGPGDFVDDAILSRQTQRVLEEYRKRFYHGAAASWDLAAAASNTAARCTLTVSEGERASLRRVRFSGNTYRPPGFGRRLAGAFAHRPAVSEWSVPPAQLRQALRPRLWHLFSFMTKRGVYDPDALRTDRDTLRGLYENRGYLDARIGEPEVRAFGQGKLEAVFPIEEGPQYRLGALRVEGVSLFPESNLWALVDLKPGDVAALDRIHGTADRLRDYYQARGHMRTEVTPALEPPRTGTVVALAFTVKEGSQVSIRHIDIRGATRTRDKVIRRELLVQPGEVYNLAAVRRSEAVLRNLGFFETVSAYPRETPDPARDDLVFEVEEKRTGQFMVGAGYSSVDDVVGFIELAQGNFDLLHWPFVGAGQKLRVRAQLGSETRDYELSFVEPWFLDRKLSLGADVYDRTRNNISRYYDESRLGGALTLGRPLPGFFQRVNLQYRLEQIDIHNVSSNAVPAIRNDEGDWNDSSLRLTFVHDSRDSVFIPTRGGKLSLSGFASGGPLGFDVDVYGFEGDGTIHLPLLFDHVLSLRGWVKTVESYGGTDTVPVFDRLFLGGPRTLRGYRYLEVSPYEGGQPVGGRSAALATVEYTVPLYKNILRAAAFYDAGQVWSPAFDFRLSEYCSDIGLGLRLDIPMFPIRLDYAWPLERSGEVERTGARFNFWLGYGF